MYLVPSTASPHNCGITVIYYRLHDITKKVLLLPCKHCDYRDVITFTITMSLSNWQRSIVVRTLVSAGELSLFCARLLAG